MSGSLRPAGPAIESTPSGLGATSPGVLSQIDVQALSIWVLAAAIVAYLAFDGGGYDPIVRNQVGFAVWWGVLVCALCGVLPARPLQRSAWIGLGLFAAFAGWTAIATASSHSTERSLDELSRVVCYLGVLVLAVGIHRDRERAVRLTVSAVATAIAVVAALALLSRLRPGTFTTASQTASFLPGTRGRLGWPINYWNALAAMLALGLPLLLAIASSARRLLVQAAAAAAVPILALCAYLTFSRGGALAMAGGVIVYFCIGGDRIPKLLTGLATAAGSAALIAGAVHRNAVEKGLTNAAARHEGRSLLIAVLLVAAGTGLAQVGIGLAVRHGTRPRWLQISRVHARNALIVSLVGAVLIAVAAGAPSKLSHAWNDFKRPSSASLSTNSLARFGSTSGNQRYDYWKVAVNASSGHLLTGWGPGTFQLVWLPRAPYYSYVSNAHSLYFETLVEDGAVALALLVAFLAFVLWRGVRVATRARYEARALAAAALAACMSFAISAAVDWVWQVPAVTIAALLLMGAILAPERRSGEPKPAGASLGADERKHAGASLGVDEPEPAPAWRGWTTRAGLVVVALVSLIAISIPLATASAMRQSQDAAASGNLRKALSEAQGAARDEPGAASPQVQQALVLERQGDLAGAAAAARKATTDEPLNWSLWLVLSRLEAEGGNPQAALVAFRQARSLNPTSPIFGTHRHRHA